MVLLRRDSLYDLWFVNANMCVCPLLQLFTPIAFQFSFRCKQFNDDGNLDNESVHRRGFRLCSRNTCKHVVRQRRQS